MLDDYCSTAIIIYWTESAGYKRKEGIISINVRVSALFSDRLMRRHNVMTACSRFLDLNSRNYFYSNVSCIYQAAEFQFRPRLFGISVWTSRGKVSMFYQLRSTCRGNLLIDRCQGFRYIYNLSNDGWKKIQSRWNVDTLPVFRACSLTIAFLQYCYRLWINRVYLTEWHAHLCSLITRKGEGGKEQDANIYFILVIFYSSV